ncbi:MAG: triose-phosphate isomerase [Bacteroidetes bacterium GWF2_49_14]|nr:MAG: triose-phosphate isomerase [Bacteroidetes bacterium GWF2_49_14]
MRKRIVAGNWKMNTDVTAGTQLAAELMTLLAEKPAPDNVGVAIAVPFTHITEVARCIDQKVICLAAQNCSSESAGAYTGEVSATMLKSASVMAVLVGHSERRSYFHEDHPTLARKVDQVLANGMRPVFCFGEVLEEREGGIQNRIVEAQLMESVFHLSETDFSKLILAYEPVWAIGTGKVASPEQAQEMHKYVRDLIAGRYGAAVADGTTILYGGSCKSSNAVEIFSKPDVDGGLIGGASLDAPEFHRIIHSF